MNLRRCAVHGLLFEHQFIKTSKKTPELFKCVLCSDDETEVRKRKQEKAEREGLSAYEKLEEKTFKKPKR